jgi:predicted  nucleic acid-binding Zn-ribbon protein
MDLKQTNNLDLSINKDDLIDIMIDNKLTELETELEMVTDKKETLSKKVTNNHDETHEKHDKYLLKKFLPKTIVTDEIPTVNGGYYSNTTLRFRYNDYEIVINSCDTRDVSAFCKTKQAENDKLNEQIKELNIRINVLDVEIFNIQKSPKRLKAQMLKNFLGSSKDGQQVLELINTKTKITAKRLLAGN